MRLFHAHTTVLQRKNYSTTVRTRKAAKSKTILFEFRMGSWYAKTEAAGRLRGPNPPGPWRRRNREGSSSRRASEYRRAPSGAAEGTERGERTAAGRRPVRPSPCSRPRIDSRAFLTEWHSPPSTGPVARAPGPRGPPSGRTRSRPIGQVLVQSAALALTDR